MGLVLEGQGQSQGQSCRPVPHRLQQILMCHCLHLLILVSQVALKKTVTVRSTLRLCGQRVLVVYGFGKRFCQQEIVFHP
jgi:hypothetical protein